MAMRTKMPRVVGLGTALLATTVEQDTSILEPRQGWLHSWLPFLPTWSPSSPQQLQQAEHRLLGPLHTQSTGFYVNVGEMDGRPVRVWTRRWGPPPGPAASPPLVMVHGMGAGLAMFLPNIGQLAKVATATRRLYLKAAFEVKLLCVSTAADGVRNRPARVRA